MPPPLPAPCAPRRRGAHGRRVRSRPRRRSPVQVTRVFVREKRLTAREGGGSGRAPNPLRAPVRRRPPPLREGPAEGGSRPQPPPPGGQGEQEVVGRDQPSSLPSPWPGRAPAAAPGGRVVVGQWRDPDAGPVPNRFVPAPRPGATSSRLPHPVLVLVRVQVCHRGPRAIPPRTSHKSQSVLHCSPSFDSPRPRRPRPPPRR